MKKSMAAVLFAVLAGAAIAEAQTQPVAVTVTIRADQPGAKIDRNIYGQFAEHLGRGIY